jgi:hypothetical protein
MYRDRCHAGGNVTLTHDTLAPLSAQITKSESLDSQKKLKIPCWYAWVTCRIGCRVVPVTLTHRITGGVSLFKFEEYSCKNANGWKRRVKYGLLVFVL